MVNLQKSGDSAVKFVFTDSDHYLYGNGVVDVPVNSLLLVIDESDMVTFKKLSGDPFLSFRADNSNLGTKAAIEQFYKDNMVGSSGGDGSGVTPSEVQEMIDNSLEDYYTDDEVDAALSGKASVSDVTAVANDVQTVSGQVQTKVATSDFNTYSAATATALGNKQDALQYYSEIDDIEESLKFSHIEVRQGTDEDNVSATFDVSAHYTEDEKMSSVDLIAAVQNDNGFGSSEIAVYNGQINITNDYQPNEGEASESHIFMSQNGTIEIGNSNEDGGTLMFIQPTGVTINNERVATEPYVDAATSGKADTSAVTAAIDAAITGKVDTSAITSSITSGSTDDEIPTAKATYDAIQAGGGGITVDPTLDTGSTNPVANSAITTAINAKADKTGCLGVVQITNQNGNYKSSLNTYNAVGSGGQTKGYFGGINGQPIAVQYSNLAKDFQLVEKSAITSSITSGSTDAQVPSAKATYEAITAATTGGGATYSAGTNISIDTANTINCTLNLRNGSGDNSLVGTDNSNTASKNSTFCFGQNLTSSRMFGVSFGLKNVFSESGSQSIFGQSGNSLFTIGNGNRNGGQYHNALDIRQNGDIYFPDTDNTTYQNHYEKPMVRLQDMYGALGGLKLVSLTQSEYENLPTKDSNTLYIVSNVVI